MEEFKFPKDFLMGTSVSAVMVEGGNRNTNWYNWCEEGHVLDGSHIMRGTDHWNRYPGDIQIMKELNNDTFCTSIEWSRIEPEQGKYDMEAIKHYRDEISLLIKNGIRPMITLYHFSNPQWFDDMGGWGNRESVDIFTKYARFAVSQLGDLVNDWLTFCDINITLISQYLWAWFPPGKRDAKIFIKAVKNIIRSHISVYQEIHKVRKEKNFPGETLAGFAMHLRLIEPLRNNFSDKLATKIGKHFSQEMLLTGMTTGKFSFPIGLGGYPAGKGKFYDFLGVNYFTRSIVRFKPSVTALFCEMLTKENAELTEGQWEIYPEGMYHICKEYSKKYDAPIFIVQNGLMEKVEKKRPRIIYENLRHVARLIEEGVPIKRFYIWTLIDIFECHQGESMKLGIVENDFETQTRTIRKSGHFYGEVCKNKGVTKEILEKYF